jgi:hypothetical protein
MVRFVAVVAFFALLTPAAYAQQPGDIEASRGERGQYVVLFGLNSAALDAEARRVIRAAADDYQSTGAARVEVRGHADTLGDAAYNEALSRRRADAVADELIGLGVPPAAITRAGLGETALLVATGDGVREPRNRRAEIELERPSAPPVAGPPPPAPRVEPAPAADRGPPATVGTAATGPRTNAVELALTEETLQAAYFTDAGVVGLRGSSLALGLLLSDDRDIVASGMVMVPNILANAVPGPLSLTIGGKVYAAFLDDPDDGVFGLAPGVEARYALPFGTPMAVVGNIFYAPDILTFGDADDVLDFNVRYEVQFIPRAVGFVGYRLLDFDRDEAGDDEIVENVQLGLRFAF